MKILKDQNGRVGIVTGYVNKYGQTSCLFDKNSVGITVQPEDKKEVTTISDATGFKVITATFWTLQESGEYRGRWYDSPAVELIGGRLIHLCLCCGKEITVPSKDLQDEFVNDAAYNFCDRECMLSYEAASELYEEQWADMGS